MGDVMDVNQINALVFAYLGDSIYEFYVREYLIKKKINKVNDLQIESKKYVSAKSQAKFLEMLINSNIILEHEMDIIKRARNTKVNSHPKNTDIITYKHATALEALIGYLYIRNEKERIDVIIHYILEFNNLNI